MARTIEIIYDEMLQRKSAMPSLDTLDSTSKVAIWRLLLYIVAVSIWTIEKLFDTHKSELTTAIGNQKSGTLSWYRTAALKFQYGFDLLDDSDKFNNTNATAEQITTSKIIKYAAVNEGGANGVIIVKIAGEINNTLSPILTEQYDSITAYFNEIKYAGSDITIINYLPDHLFLNVRIYRDPLVIDSTGMSILTGEKPVEIAINQFLKDLPFNGELILAHLIDKLQNVQGVKIPHLVQARSAWIDPVTNGYEIPQQFDVKTIPVSGYYQILNFDEITYVV